MTLKLELPFITRVLRFTKANGKANFFIESPREREKKEKNKSLRNVALLINKQFLTSRNESED